MPWIKWFKDINKDDVPIAGGKGANLGEMYNNGFPVPPGFVVTANSFREFTQKTGIDIEINKYLKNINIEDSDELDRASENIKQLFMQANIPDAFISKIASFYRDLQMGSGDLKGINNKALELIRSGRDLPIVAVRSSATAEDLPSISKDEHILAKINDKFVYKRMEEVYALINSLNNPKIEIPSLEENELKWHNVREVYKHKANKDKVYKIVTVTGREITVSPNHTLIVLDEDTLKPKEIKHISELKGNEKLPVIKKLVINSNNQDKIDILEYMSNSKVVEKNGNIKIKSSSSNWKIQNGLKRKIPLTKDFAYFLGIYLAEGSTYSDNCVMITNENEDVINRVISFLESVNLYNNQKINKNTLRIYCKPLLRFLHEIAGKPLNEKGKGKLCKVKEIPPFIFGWDKDLIGEFLKGAFDGDGYISKSSIEYCSTSKMLVGGMIKLLEILGIEFYFRTKENSFNIVIPAREAEKFKENIGITIKKKLDRLNKLVDSVSKNIQIKNRIDINKELSRKIREEFENNLPKQEVYKYLCPSCNSKIEKTSYYKNKDRFYCESCKKTFYEVKKQKINSYVNYDEKGRIKKGTFPWNKAKLSGNFSNEKFQELLEEYNITKFDSFFSDSISWDQIDKITPIEYDEEVYDFNVPEVQNFAAGIGGIITHNSASFAGQQATFLNIKGTENLIQAIKECWASLYTPRAIYYREKNNFPHEKVAIAVVVQQMINSAVSGVMFSINPATNEESEIMIDAAFGLGESVVGGELSPTEYIIDKKTGKLKDKKMHKQEWMYTRDYSHCKTIKKKIPQEKWYNEKLNSEQLKKLWSLAVKVEKHYKKPQDMEWAFDNHRVYLVQARPVTTFHKHHEELDEIFTGDAILKGLPASPGGATGQVKIILSSHELNNIKKGDIMVTKMTNPDMVPAMQRAAAIVTDEGGVTSHAAIVSREMGTPCIVGTEKATSVLHEGQLITVNGTKGEVYEGKTKVEKAPELEAPKEIIPTNINVKVILDLPDYAKKVAKTKPDGVGLLRLEGIIAAGQKHPAQFMREGKYEDYVSLIEQGVGKIAEAFPGKPIWIRTSDIRTDEFRNIEGGDKEDKESNPMMGWHGIRRGLDQPDILRAEFEGIKRVQDHGHDNVGVMLPQIISADEVRKAKRIREEVGLRGDFGVMIETPGAALTIEKICDVGIDFISFGTNDLTQFTLGVDRNNSRVQNLYNELHPGVLRLISHVIKTCKERGVETSICGQAGSKPEMVKFLANEGINSISANPDAVQTVRKVVHDEETKIQPEF